MRKLLPSLGILFLLAGPGCKKNDPEIYNADYLRSINGASTYPVDFSAPVDQLTCSQSFYTGGATKISRWTFSFHSLFNNNSFNLTIPGTDTSKTLPTGTPLYFSYNLNTTTPHDFELSVLDAGSVFSASDSGVFVITFSLFDKKASGMFTASLYGVTGNYIITQGSINDVPITYAQ